MYKLIILAAVLLLEVVQAKPSSNSTLSRLYNVCQSDNAHCIKSSVDCDVTRSCDFAVAVLAYEGYYEIAFAVTRPHEYVAIGFNAKDNNMSPALTMYCMDTGDLAPKVSLGVNPEKHQHVLSEGSPNGFQVLATEFSDEGVMACGVRISSAITINDITFAPANEKYYVIAALGMMKDGVPDYHTDKWQNKEMTNFNSATTMAATVLLTIISISLTVFY